MKIDFALTRKEADVYRSQGLHKEALELYAKFIASSAKIDPGTKSSVKKQVDIIESEMNCGDSGASQELSRDRIESIKKGCGTSAIGPDLVLPDQDQHQPSGCNQRDEADIEDSDWLDGLADIYALVSNDKDYSSSETLKRKTTFSDTNTPEVLLNQDSPKRKVFQRNYTVKSFLNSIAAFFLVGSIFFYFVDWFSEVKRNENGEVSQKTATIVIKKIPSFVSDQHASTLSNDEMEDHGPLPSQEKAAIGVVLPAADPVETQEVDKHLLSPTDDTPTATTTPSGDLKKDGTTYSEMPAVDNSDVSATPEEPDPASVIDYVLKKRRRQF